MATLQLTNEQLRLVQTALDFYSRVGIGQWEELLMHPTFDNVLQDRMRPNKPFEVGDSTERGIIVEIGEDYIKTEGVWNSEKEIRTWTDIENIKHSTNNIQRHDAAETVLLHLTLGRNMLIGEDLGAHASWGLFHPKVDSSCQVAYDILQVIRHEFWKADPERSNVNVASDVIGWTKDSDKIKVIIDNNK